MAADPVLPKIPFVGRDSERSQLHRILRESLVQRQPKFILLQGEFGIGKTALVEKFLFEVENETPEIIIGRGYCSLESELNGLVPFSQLLTELYEDLKNKKVVSVSFADFIKEVAPAWIELIPTVGTALSRTITAGQKLLDGNSFSQENTFVQFANTIMKFAEKRSIVAFIDDMHWADSSSLRLWFHLARHIKDRSVLLIAAYRPVEALETGGNADLFRSIRANLIRYGAVEIVLEKGISVKEYSQNRYPLNMFPDQFTSHVQVETEGHPLYVSQLFSLWQDQKVIVSSPASSGDSLWCIASERKESFPVIPGLSAVLDERIRLMGDQLKDLLTLASIEGESFTAQVIARLNMLDDYVISERLDTLEERYHLVQLQETQRVDELILDFYKFAHRFFREYIYDNLSPAKKRFLHRRVAEVLESLYQDRRKIAGQLSMHYYEAGDLEKSVRYAILAADFEGAQFAWAEAEKWAKKTLEWLGRMPKIMENDDTKISALETVGMAAYYQGSYLEAYASYQKVFDLISEKDPHSDRLADVAGQLALICDATNRLDEGLDFIKKGFAALEGKPISELYYKLIMARSVLEIRKGKNTVVIEEITRALNEMESLPQSETLEKVRAHLNHWLAVAYCNTAQYQNALTAYQKCIEILTRIPDNKLLARALTNTADVYIYLSDYEPCNGYLEKALRTYVEIGDLDGQAFVYATYGRLFLYTNRLKQSIEFFQKGITIAEEIEATWDLPSMLADLAAAYLELGDLQKAHQLASDAVNRTDGNVNEVGRPLVVLGKVEIGLGNYNQAEQSFQKALSVFTDAGDQHMVALTLRDIANFYVVCCEDWLKAAAELDKAFGILQTLNLPKDLSSVQVLQDSVRSHLT